MEFCQDIDKASQFARHIATHLRDDSNEPSLEPPARQGNEYWTFFAGDMVIRIARNEAVQAGMEKEADLLTELSIKMPGTVPQVMASQPENHFMVIERLPGEPLTAAMLGDLSAKDNAAIAQQLGSFIGRMHSLMPQDQRIIRDNPKFDKKITLSKIHHAIMYEKDEDMVARLCNARIYLGQYGSNTDFFTVIHGDLKPENLLYDRSTKRLSVINFADNRQAYAHEEFVALSHAYPQVFVEQVKTAYEAASGRSIDMRKVTLARDVAYVTHNPIAQEGKFSLKALMPKV